MKGESNIHLQHIVSVGVCTRLAEYVPYLAVSKSAYVLLVPKSKSVSLQALAVK